VRIAQSPEEERTTDTQGNNPTMLDRANGSSQSSNLIRGTMENGVKNRDVSSKSSMFPILNIDVASALNRM